MTCAEQWGHVTCMGYGPHWATFNTVTAWTPALKDIDTYVVCSDCKLYWCDNFITK